jgi:hypothetical protein
MFSRIREYPSWSVNKQYIAMQSRQLISFDLNRKASWTLMTIKLLWHDLLCSFCSLHQPVGQYGFQIMVIVYMFLEQQMLFPMCFWMSLALYSLLYQFQYCYSLSLRYGTTWLLNQPWRHSTVQILRPWYGPFRII